MKENLIAEKSFDFAIRVVNLYKHLAEDKKEFVLSKQVLRCGTSIGANVREAEKAQSNADFYTKLTIALKEANETLYWLRLMYATDFLTEKEFSSLETDAKELVAILVSITKTLKSKL